ncbi:25281_t:CDS:2, partial [Gigaspora margarita]
LAARGRVSYKATVLLQDIIQQHFQQHGEDWKDLRLNKEEEQMVTEPLLVPKALSDNSKSSLKEEEEQNTNVIDLSISVNWQKQPVTID